MQNNNYKVVKQKRLNSRFLVELHLKDIPANGSSKLCLLTCRLLQ